MTTRKDTGRMVGLCTPGSIFTTHQGRKYVIGADGQTMIRWDDPRFPMETLINLAEVAIGDSVGALRFVADLEDEGVALDRSRWAFEHALATLVGHYTVRA